MRNKKCNYILAIILMLFIGINNVRAEVTGNTGNGNGSDSTSSSTSGECGSGNVLCPYNNRNNLFRGVRVSLYYVDEGRFFNVRAQGGSTPIKSVYIYSSHLEGQSSDQIWISAASLNKDGMSLDLATGFENMSKRMFQYFGADDNGIVPIKDQEKFAKAFKNIFGVSLNGTDFHEESLAASPTSPVSHGYRIIIEPVIKFKRNGKFEYLTAKEVAEKRKAGIGHTCIDHGAEGSGSTCVTSFRETSRAFYTEFEDVGISHKTRSQCDTTNANMVADVKSGCGYNIIDISNVIHKCYSRTVIGDDGGLTCKNIDKNNETYFTEKYEEKSCSGATKEETTNTEYGKLYNDETDNCNAYCIESAFVSFPGGISAESKLGQEIRPGGYFVWPARFGTGNMTMSMISTFDCTIISKQGKTCTQEEIENLTKSVTGKIEKNEMSAKIMGGTNKKIDTKAEIETMSSSIATNKDSKGNPTLYYTKSAYFKIPENKNRYSNRITGIAFDTPETNRIDRGEGVISLNFDDDTDKIYELSISKKAGDVQLGTGNQFGSKITDYTCTYTIQPVTECYCTFGLKKNLQHLVNKGMTCAQAQWYTENVDRSECESYCIAETNIPSEKIETGDKINITDCVIDIMKKKGYSSISAAENACRNRDARCGKRTCTDPDTNKEYDITNCVYEKIKNLDIDITTREGVQVLEKYDKECSKQVKECDKNSDCSCKDDVNNCVKNEGLSFEFCRVRYNCPKVCFPSEYKCYWNHKWWDITSCIKDEGYSPAYCRNKYCPASETCEEQGKGCYYCYTPDDEPVDITECVTRKNAKGIPYLEAKAMCTKEESKCNPGVTGICYYGCEWKSETKGNKTYYRKYCSVTKGSEEKELCDSIELGYCKKSNKCQKIIYRTIDLNNPFPGKSGKGVTTDFSNNGIAGRKPNYNWNSVELVKNKILQARGQQGDDLFKTKPLLTITLTPENIRAIVKDYNKERQYSDFTLDCKGDDGSFACVSNNFLRNSQYVTINYNKSVCGQINSVDEFNQCYGNKEK